MSANELIERLRDYANHGTRPWIGIQAVFLKAADLLASQAAEIERLREALVGIEKLLSDEITVRFGTSSHLTQAECAGKSVIYSLLVVPRNMARQALRGTGADHG